MAVKYTEVNRFTVKFPSKSANEGFARAAVAAFIAQLDPTLDELGDVRTAVSEAVTNGYKDAIGDITMTVKLLEPDTVEIVVADRGCGIPDISRAREPLFTTGGAERSGMGFTIMESFMDSLRIRSAPGKGTSVTMRKRLNTRRYR